MEANLNARFRNPRLPTELKVQRAAQSSSVHENPASNRLLIVVADRVMMFCVRTGEFRIGHGFDVHRFRRGRKLILGGVEIPYPMGLAGHSDADVLWHAVINALLGAMSEGDIGMHFPDTDPRYKGIASTKMLEKVLRLMRQGGFKLVNVDVTLVAQQPKLAPYYAAMRKAMARRFRIAENRISIKATTTEKLGWVGQGKGMAATAVVLLRAT